MKIIRIMYIFFFGGGGEGKKTEVQSKETGERRIKSNNSHK